MLGVIGKSIEVNVTLFVSKNDIDIINKFGNLAELFIVSNVDIYEDNIIAEDDFCRVEVVRSTGVKCNRCLRYTHDTDYYGTWERVCKRCQDVLVEMGF